jgi:hypothetical protein
LAKTLGPELKAHLIRRRQELGRLKSAAKAVKSLGLEADFPDAEFEWKVQALKSAVKHSNREAAVGLCSNEPRLYESCVNGLLELGEAFLAIELAESWAVEISPEARVSGLEAKTLIESTHLRLPATVNVIVINDEAMIPEMCATLLQAPVLGLDAEWQPTQGARASLWQIATAEVVYLVDLLTLGCSEALGSALASVMVAQNVTKVTFEGHKDIGRISGEWPALGGCLRVSNLVDLREVAVTRRARVDGLSKKQARDGLSLASLAQRYLASTLDKTMQMSNWARRPLSEPQIHYAALDAWVPLQVHRTLEELEGA